MLKFDQNTPPLPGVPQVPLAASMSRLEQYPDGTYRDLREAAASYVGLAPENVVVGAGADDLILLVAQTFLGPGVRAAIDMPTYALYGIATRLHGGTVVDAEDEAELRWVCNPNNPVGGWVEAGDAGRARARRAEDDSGGRRGVRRVRRAVVRAVGRRAREPRRDPDDVEGLRLRRAPRGLRRGTPGDREAADRAPGAGTDRRAGGGNRRGSSPRAQAR